MPLHTTLLVVDDDPGVLAALCEALSFYGYRVITATTAQEAEQALQHLGVAAIHLVIADIHLTHDVHAVEGYVLYQRWHLAYPDLPFILISAHPSSWELPAIRTGAVCFLCKPFSIPTLWDAIRDILGGASLHTGDGQRPRPFEL